MVNGNAVTVSRRPVLDAIEVHRPGEAMKPGEERIGADDARPFDVGHEVGCLYDAALFEKHSGSLRAVPDLAWTIDIAQDEQGLAVFVRGQHLEERPRGDILRRSGNRWAARDSRP